MRTNSEKCCCEIDEKGLEEEGKREARDKNSQ